MHNSGAVTAVTIFWGVTTCSLIEVYRRFGGTYSLHLHVRSASQLTTKRASSDTSNHLGYDAVESDRFRRNLLPENDRQALLAAFLLGFFNPEDGDRTFIRNMDNIATCGRDYRRGLDW
jgi:hypothetical protein